MSYQIAYKKQAGSIATIEVYDIDELGGNETVQVNIELTSRYADGKFWSGTIEAFPPDLEEFPLNTFEVEDIPHWYECQKNHIDAAINELHKKRLEYLRTELRAERISYNELAELQSLALLGLIDEGDTELLEAAGVPETD